MNRVRRAAVACLIALVASAPLAAHAVGGTEAAPSGAFALPPSWPGDRLSYHVASGQSETTVNLTWQPAEWFLDPVDGWVAVRPLTQTVRLDGSPGPAGCGEGADQELEVLGVYDLATREPRWGAGGVASGWASVCMGLPLLGGTQQQTRSMVQTLTPGQGLGPCGILNSLQGAGPGPVTVSECGEATFVARGMDGEVPTMVLEGKSGNVTVRMGFRQDIPYPVLATSAHATWTLTGFERGAGPDQALGPAPAPVALPALEFAEAGRLGPDESGLVQEYSLAQAVEDARTAPRFRALRDYMTTHPDWILVRAEAFQVVTEDEPIPAWSLHFTDHEEGLQFQWTKGQDGDWVLPMPDAVPTQDAVHAEATPAVTYAESKLLPTASSVVARWQAFARPEAGETVLWGYSLACQDKECTPWVQAGDISGITAYSASSDPLEPQPQPSREEDDLSSLRFDAGGQILHMSLGTRTHEVGPYDPTMPAPAYKEPAKAPDRIASALPIPSLPAAAGMGGLGLLAAVAYYFWPAAKGGFATLFSRVHEDKLLEHPVRRRIVSLVEAHPGIHYQALARAAQVGNGSLEHHLRKLLASGHLAQRKGPGYTCFFPRGTGAATMNAAPVLKSEGARRILEAIGAQPGAPSGTIALQAGLDPATVTHHVERLSAAGLVEARRDGRMVRLYATGAPPSQ